MKKTEQQSQMLKILTTVYEDSMKGEDYRDVLAFALVMSLVNDNLKNPNTALDRVLHYWVKTMSVLSKGYSGLPEGEA